ncbi:MAG TPA: hypothetical protein VG097_12345 [Gemmata sp.]|nr:hypothetical protein [Gemmata sp.]
MAAASPAATASTDTAGALQPLATALDKISQSIASLLPNVGGLGAAFANVGKQFTNVTSSFLEASVSFTGGLTGMVSGIMGLGEAIGGMLGGVASLGQTMAGFVQLANPAIVQMFTNALQDMQAIIGQALTPILQVVTQVIRIGADALASFLPQLGSVIAAMLSSFMPVVRIIFDAFSMIGQGILLVFQAAQPLIEMFGMMYTAIYETFFPVIKLLIETVAGALGQAMKWLSEAFQQILPYILAFTMYLKDLIDKFVAWIRELLGLAGVKLPDFVKPEEDKSVGAAAKGTNIGSVESVISTAMKSAFALGTGAQPPDDPVMRTVALTGGILAKAQEIYVQIEGFVARFPEWLGETLRQFVKWLGDQVLAIPLEIAKAFQKQMDAALRPIFDSIFHDVKGPGIDGSGKSTGNDTLDRMAAGAARIGGWLDRLISPPPPPPPGTV